jgi:hypothetical protein
MWEQVFHNAKANSALRLLKTCKRVKPLLTFLNVPLRFTLHSNAPFFLPEKLLQGNFKLKHLFPSVTSSKFDF